MQSGRTKKIRGYRPVDYREGEVWKPVPLHPMFEASNFGRIRRITLMPEILGNNGYAVVDVLSNEPKKRTRVTTHQLVAAAFHGLRPLGTVVNHIDGNSLNNRPENLEYVTHKENIQHAAKLGRMSRDYVRKLTRADVESIRRMRRQGIPQIEVARLFNVHRHTIQNVMRGVTNG